MNSISLFIFYEISVLTKSSSSTAKQIGEVVQAVV